MITSLEVPDTVIVVVRSSNVTTVESSGMLTVVVTMFSMDTSSFQGGDGAQWWKFPVECTVVDISGRITSDEVTRANGKSCSFCTKGCIDGLSSNGPLLSRL